MTGSKRKYKIGVIGGDGVGPEVVAEGLKVLEHVARQFGFSYEVKEYPWSAQHYLDTGVTMPESVLEEYKTMDAVYLGALGDPRLEPGFIERPVIMGLRFGLDLYVNLRPIKLYAEEFCPLKGKKPEDVDMVVVRENTEDAYTGIGGIFKKGTPDEVAIADMVFTRKGAERAIRYAFELARKRNKKKKVTLIDKANAIRAMDLWTRTFEEVGEEYPDIERDHAYIDAACMWMVKNPEWFDVAVTSNLFGDIITDIGAMIQGGLGIAASGNIHPGKVSMFEPIHGSAPKYAGKNVANPMAAIAAMGMLLDYVGEAEAAAKIDLALRGLLSSGKVPSLGADSGLSTTRVGEMVREVLG
ncbi:3-isopropylmalate dehydrogenase [Paradesulfitobacterium ferrireducens]|uniref:3-isopropylmalate dehydrogenase n=1 Tax=Paradesulfitobacterium ferrireducens TaxID=2816476 RepID=UPI001A8FC71C|nr:3-isopropylmalate dehydrogenase [Paradesulfitobacterium ferrireducens]